MGRVSQGRARPVASPASAASTRINAMVPQIISMVRAVCSTAWPRETGSGGGAGGRSAVLRGISPASAPATAAPASTPASTHTPAAPDPSQPPMVPSRNMGLMVAQRTASPACSRAVSPGHRDISRPPVGEPPPQPSSVRSSGFIRVTRLTSISESAM